MMRYREIKRLVKLVEESNIGELEVEFKDIKVRIAKSQPHGNHLPSSVMPYFPYPALPPSGAGATQAPGANQEATVSLVPSASPASVSLNLIEVQSPMVGTFYRAPAPEAPPYVEVGDIVRPGQVLCIIEAMKIMNEIEAEISGRIREICVENAQAVEFGQVLFRIEPL